MKGDKRKMPIKTSAKGGDRRGREKVDCLWKAFKGKNGREGEARKWSRGI